MPTCRTNVPGVYALGDVAGRQLLAHKAMHEGIVCVEHIAGEGHHTVDYENVPNCTYCHPEVASVGLTEEQAKEQGLDIEVGKFPWVGIGRAVASGHAEGFIKVIRDKKYSEILGAHIVGPHATELIAEFVLGRHLESTVEEMERGDASRTRRSPKAWPKARWPRWAGRSTSSRCRTHSFR